MAHNISGSQMSKRRRAVYEKSDFACVMCGWKPYKPDNWDGKSALFEMYRNRRGKRVPRILELDHIIPFSKGGVNAQSNLQALCTWCNNAKADSMVKAAKIVVPDRLRKVLQENPLLSVHSVLG